MPVAPWARDQTFNALAGAGHSKGAFISTSKFSPGRALVPQQVLTILGIEKCTTRVTDAFSIESATNEQDRAGALHRSWSTSRTEGEVGVTNALHTDSATPKVRPACQRTTDWRRAGVRRNPTPSQQSLLPAARVRRAWNPNSRVHLAGRPSAREDLAELARLFSCRRLALIRSTSRGHGHQFHACAEVAHRPLRGRFGPVRILTRSCRPRRARGRRW